MTPRARRLLRASAIGAVLIGIAAVFACNAIVLRGGTPGARVEPADAILVLGAGLRPSGAPSDVLVDRLETALALYREGRAPRILVSGDHASESYDEPGAMRRWLEARGVPPSRIDVDEAGFDTFLSIARAPGFGARRVIVVTQAFHLPRALWVARRLGLDAEGAAADRRTYRGAAWFSVREVVSRTKAVFDVVRSRTA